MLVRGIIGILILCLILSIISCTNLGNTRQGDEEHEAPELAIGAGSPESEGRVEGGMHKEYNSTPKDGMEDKTLLESDLNPDDRMSTNQWNEPSGRAREETKPTVESQRPSRQLPKRLSQPKIIVKKAERLLELWDGEELFDVYPIALGFNPVGHKKREGDGRTPEGNYYVCTRNDKSLYYKSLGVSYPNKEDAMAALEEEAIEVATYESIAESIDTDGQPPWKTPMGGEIMIHGHGSHEDWTLGCVAVDDDIMDILWQLCPLKTPIIIEP